MHSEIILLLQKSKWICNAFVSCSYFFSCHVVLKFYINFNTYFFYPYNFDIFLYMCRVYVIFHIVSYFNYFFISNNYIVFNITRSIYIVTLEFGILIFYPKERKKKLYVFLSPSSK